MTKKIRIAFILDDLEVSDFVFNLIKNVSLSKEKFFDPLIIYTSESKDRLDNKKIIPLNIFDYIKQLRFSFINCLIKIINKIEHGVVTKKFPNYYSSSNLKVLNGLEYCSISTNNNKTSVCLNQDDAKTIERYKIDCALDLSSQDIGKKLIQFTRLGVIYLSHSDNCSQIFRPCGFWEVLENKAGTQFSIYNSSRDINGTVVKKTLCNGRLMTQSLWGLNSANLLSKSSYLIQQLFDELHASGGLNSFNNDESETIKREIKSSLSLISYIFFIIIPIAFQSFKKKLFGEKIRRWSIGYSKESFAFENFESVIEVSNPPKRYLADPFVVKHQDKTVIFVEDYFIEDQKGKISAIQINGDKNHFLGVVLEENFHMSFPCIFIYKENIYMIPETSEINQIRLYICKEFPLKWELFSVVMDNVSAADSIIFTENDTWFLLTNICSSNIGDHQSELHVFWSDDPTINKWLPTQSRNPILFDSTKARNGGFFQHKNTTYRINQIPGKNHYGKSFGINRVIAVDSNKYFEKRLCDFELSNFSGTHHFHSNEEYSVIDFSRDTLISDVLKE